MTLTPKQILQFLLTCILLLLVAHLSAIVLEHGFDRDYVFGFVPLVNMNTESNLPTLFSALLLVCCGLVMVIAGFRIGQFKYHWWAIGFTLFVLAVDEIYGFHEYLFFVLGGGSSERVRELAENVSWRWHDTLPWLVGFSIFMIAIYIPFFRSIGLPYSSRIIGSGALYLLGAAGLDMMGGIVHSETQSLLLVLAISSFEELFEMLGVAYCTYFVCGYLVSELDSIVIRIE